MDHGILPTSPEPTLAVPPTLPTTAAVINDALASDLGDTFAELTADMLGATQTSVATFGRTNTMGGVTLEHLFGKGLGTILAAEEQSARFCDPALLDTETILGDVFGDNIGFVHEAFNVTDAAHAHLLKKALDDARLADCMSELDEFFGPHAEYVKTDQGASLRPNVTMSAAFPHSGRGGNSTASTSSTVKSEGTSVGELLRSTVLLTMPTVHPNRQILHFETAPYNPATSRPKESTDRKTFTPQNIMMWTYDRKSRRYLSNTRVIQWSDGTTTLHVGAESYDIETCTDGALSFLGERRHMYRCDKAYSAIIETVPVDNHVTVMSRSDKMNSIDAITAARAAKAVAENAALSIGLPITGLPAFVGDAGGRKSTEEEYVDTERAALKKLIAQMERDGTPMTVAEQMRRDAQILNDVIAIGSGIDALVAKQHARRAEEEEERRAAKAEREAANAMKTGTKRVRIPGGIGGEGAEKRARAERKTDREPTGYENGMTAEEENEAALEAADAEDLSGDKWRAALMAQLQAIAQGTLDERARSHAEGTIEAIAGLSRTGAVEEVRSFLSESADDLSVANEVEALTLLVERVEGEQ